jgi:glucan phosphorylase
LNLRCCCCCCLSLLQSIVNGFQHEQPDYWLTFGNPWEIERLIVSYPIKFYGHVSVHQEEGRQVFRWNAGEQVSPPQQGVLWGGYHLAGASAVSVGLCDVNVSAKRHNFIAFLPALQSRSLEP